MRGLPTKATLILHGAGVTVTEVARAAGIAQRSVSAQLAGRRLLQDKTLEAIRKVADEATCAEVQIAAGAERSAYLLEVQSGRM